jgi:hypothetical protein
MGSLTFIGHLVSIFLSFAVVTYLYYVLGASALLCSLD